MAETRFHFQLKAKVEETIDLMAISVASGACTDYPQYREKIGYINGLKAALELADDVEKEYE